MSKVAVVYWSGTGNTETMAASVLQGAKAKGAEAEMMTAAEFDASMVDAYDGIAFGCPSMGAEELEEMEFAPMFESCEGKLNGKKLVLFGSYGWGDGEWMRNWEETCESCGTSMAADYVICCGAPDDDVLTECEALGAALV